jgi:4-amino-4-deoxy-L-arabinose transferase-like glycosyltransferase
MLCAVDGAVRNESLLICLCTWALALMARWAGAWTPWRALLLGALIGAAILTKSTGVLLLPAAACALLIGGRRQGIVPAIVAVFVAVGLAMPVFLRNHALYGDVLGMKAFYAAYPATVDASAVFSQPRALAHWLYVLGAGTALSFVGEFGYMDIHLPYWIYIPLIGMVALALIRSIRRGQDGAGKEVRVAFQAFVWGVALLYVVFNLRYVQPQARYVFPAIGVLALWTVAGAARMHRHAPAALAGALLFANLYALAVLPGQFRERVEAVSGPQTPASFLKHSSASPGYFSRSISLVKMKSSRW